MIDLRQGVFKAPPTEADPSGSYLLDKILGTIGVCGSRMPLLSILPDSDVEVIRDWIIELGGSSQGILDGG